MMSSDVRIIVGHDPDYTINEIKAYEKMVRSSLHAVHDALQRGMEVEAIQEAELLKEWENYGGGIFTCDEWINMIYQSLIQKAKSSSQLDQLKGS